MMSIMSGGGFGECELARVANLRIAFELGEVMPGEREENPENEAARRWAGRSKSKAGVQNAQARSMYFPVRVSTLIFSPVLMKRGT